MRWLVVSSLLFLGACTTEQIYNAGQGWQQNRCAGLPDKTEYDRCMANAGPAYDSFKRQAEPQQKP